MEARGLKTKIAFNVALLLLVSAVVTDILVVMVLQSIWVRKQIENDKALSFNIATNLLSPALIQQEEQALIEKQIMLNGLLAGKEFHALIIASTKGDIRFQTYSPIYDPSLLKRALSQAIHSKKEKLKYLNYNWALFWWQPYDALLSMPVIKDNKAIGAMATVVSFKPIYLAIGRYNTPILFYIFINTGILTVIGLYRIFRIYLRPIDRLIIQADEYRENEDLLFTFRREDNELNRLSLALNRMLQRISSDKKKLQDSYLSLEKAYGELSEAQNEIIKAEKMASVGRLASGLAHEIGNPIGIVIGYLDLLKDDSLDPRERADFITRAQKETQRMHLIISQLLDLARPKETEHSLVFVHLLIQDVVEMMRHQPVMKKNCIELNFEATQDRIWANGEQLHQVILNLLLNAADAVENNSEDRNGHIRISTYNENNYEFSDESIIGIHVEDNGKGISDEEIGNIFDPFFTTKEPGRGTGLGLAVSYMIIKRIGGTITAESEPGKGTTIVIRLPNALQT